MERLQLKIAQVEPSTPVPETAKASMEISTTTTGAPIPATNDGGKDRFNLPSHTDNWDEYWLCMAATASIKSKDPRCCVGATIVSADNTLLSTGFNGLARGVYDDDRILENVDEKLKIVCHAEQNAIFNAARIGVPVQGATLYVTKFPCLACCNAIIQVGIRRIYTHDNRFWDDDPFDQDHSRKKDMLHQAGIEVVAPFHPEYCPKEQINPKIKKPPSKTRAIPKNSRSER